MTTFRIVETDNFDGDYPDEKFVNLPETTEEKAQKIADIINECHSGGRADRWWKVVEMPYRLAPGLSHESDI